MEVTNILVIKSRDELYRWFSQNHDKVREFWIRVNRSSKQDADVIGYVDAVEVALCFGWIDSTLKRIDSGKPFQRFSPSKERRQLVPQEHRTLQTSYSAGRND